MAMKQWHPQRWRPSDGEREPRKAVTSDLLTATDIVRKRNHILSNTCFRASEGEADGDLGMTLRVPICILTCSLHRSSAEVLCDINGLVAIYGGQHFRRTRDFCDAAGLGSGNVSASTCS